MHGERFPIDLGEDLGFLGMLRSQTPKRFVDLGIAACIGLPAQPGGERCVIVRVCNRFSKRRLRDAQPLQQEAGESEHWAVRRIISAKRTSGERGAEFIDRSRQEHKSV